jgi:hypothetical protein
LTEAKEREVSAMGFRRDFIALTLLMVMCGCIESLHPFYTEKDLVFEPALVWTWGEAGSDSKESWAFTPSGEKAYRLVVTDSDGRSGAFEAHLASLEGALILDLYPVDPELPSSTFYKDHLQKVHSFVRVVKVGPVLTMSVLDVTWLEQFLRKNPKALKHERTEDGILLTASTAELQAFILKHLKTKGAFQDSIDFERRGDGQEESAPPPSEAPRP